MLGRIELEEMEFYAYHGCFKEEQVVGNRFLVNMTVEVNIAIPMVSDNIEDAVNYVRIYELTKEEMMQKSHLLEHLAGRISKRVLAAFPQIKQLDLKVSKMNPPMGGQMKCVSVSLKEENK